LFTCQALYCVIARGKRAVEKEFQLNQTVSLIGDEVRDRVISTIATMFSVPPESINERTVATDVDVWDSLAHTARQDNQRQNRPQGQSGYVFEREAIWRSFRDKSGKATSAV
jgi:hypothetical protein